MEYRKAFWGVILVLIGLLFLLKNLNLLYFSWYEVWQLWPVLILLWGISILPIHGLVRFILSVATIVAALWLVQHQSTHRSPVFRWSEKHSWKYQGEEERSEKEYRRRMLADTTDSSFTQQIREPWDDGIRTSTLKMEVAAGSFTLGEESDELLLFRKKGRQVRYNVLSRQEDDHRHIHLSMQNTRLKGNIVNDVNIAMHPEPFWRLDLDVGAANLEADFTGHKLESVDIDGGACNIEMRFGMLVPEVYIEADAGAASLTIAIPEEAACEIKTSTFLASKDFKGFERVEKGLHRTPNFDSSEVKFYIELDAALASFVVKRY
jgi:hypothetical protein